MNEFLVELYVSKTNCAALTIAWTYLHRAAGKLTAEGDPVRLVRSIFVPEDETCFLLVEAEGVDAVHELGRRAGVPLERVVETAAGSADQRRTQ